MDLKNGWMSWVWTNMTVFMVDQRVGEMSSCRQRRAEYMATGGPSACGGNEVGLYGSSPERELVRLETVCTSRREWCRFLVSR
jgi:hypothetical protein